MKSFLLGVTALLLISGSAAMAQEVVVLKPQPPKFGEALRAQGEKTPSTIEFVNRGSASLRLLWIDEDGGHRSYATIRHGDTVRVETFLNVPWWVMDNKGNVLGVYLPEKAPGRVILPPKGL